MSRCGQRHGRAPTRAACGKASSGGGPSRPALPPRGSRTPLHLTCVRPGALELRVRLSPGQHGPPTLSRPPCGSLACFPHTLGKGLANSVRTPSSRGLRALPPLPCLLTGDPGTGGTVLGPALSFTPRFPREHLPRGPKGYRRLPHAEQRRPSPFPAGSPASGWVLEGSPHGLRVSRPPVPLPLLPGPVCAFPAQTKACPPLSPVLQARGRGLLSRARAPLDSHTLGNNTHKWNHLLPVTANPDLITVSTSPRNVTFSQSDVSCAALVRSSQRHKRQGPSSRPEAVLASHTAFSCSLLLARPLPKETLVPCTSLHHCWLTGWDAAWSRTVARQC